MKQRRLAATRSIYVERFLPTLQVLDGQFMRVRDLQGAIMAAESKRPVTSVHTQHASSGAKLNRDWWPNQLNLQVQSHGDER